MPDTTLQCSEILLKTPVSWMPRKKVAFSVCLQVAWTRSMCTLDHPFSTRVTVCASRWSFITYCKSSNTLSRREPLIYLQVARIHPGWRALKTSLNIRCSTTKNGTFQTKKNFATNRWKLFLTPALVIVMCDMMLS